MTDFPGLEFIDYCGLPDGVWEPGRLTNARNAIGRRPPKIAYLWLFDRHDSLCGQLVSHGWVFIGPVHLLVSPGARIASPILKSARAIDQAIRGFDMAAGSYQCPKLIDYEHRPTYRGYPINCLWCTDRSWLHGFEALAARCNRFVVDLSADEQPAGLITEISYLFERVALDSVAFLLDTRTADEALITGFLEQAWASMSADSANQDRTRLIPVITYDTMNFRYMAQATQSLWTGKSNVPLGRRVAQHLGW